MGLVRINLIWICLWVNWVNAFIVQRDSVLSFIVWQWHHIAFFLFFLFYFYCYELLIITSNILFLISGLPLFMPIWIRWIWIIHSHKLSRKSLENIFFYCLKNLFKHLVVPFSVKFLVCWWSIISYLGQFLEKLTCYIGQVVTKQQSWMTKKLKCKKSSF